MCLKYYSVRLTWKITNSAGKTHNLDLLSEKMKEGPFFYYLVFFIGSAYKNFKTAGLQLVWLSRIDFSSALTQSFSHHFLCNQTENINNPILTFIESKTRMLENPRPYKPWIVKNSPRIRQKASCIERMNERSKPRTQKIQWKVYIY